MPDWLVQDISVSALGLAYGEPAPRVSSVVFRAQSLVWDPVTLWRPPGRHRPLSSGWVTSSSSIIMSQALEDQHSPAYPGAMPDPRSLQPLPTGRPPKRAAPCHPHLPLGTRYVLGTWGIQPGRPPPSPAGQASAQRSPSPTCSSCCDRAEPWGPVPSCAQPVLPRACNHADTRKGPHDPQLQTHSPQPST